MAERKTKYHKFVQPHLSDITDWYRQGLTDEEVVERLGISKSSFYEYQKQHLELLESIKKGKQTADYVVEDSLNKRARGYEVEEIKITTFPDGSTKEERTRKHIPPDTTAAIFWLKNRLPEKWRDKQEVHQTGEQTIIVSLEGEEDGEE